VENSGKNARTKPPRNGRRAQDAFAILLSRNPTPTSRQMGRRKNYETNRQLFVKHTKQFKIYKHALYFIALHDKCLKLTSRMLSELW